MELTFGNPPRRHPRGRPLQDCFDSPDGHRLGFRISLVPRDDEAAPEGVQK